MLPSKPPIKGRGSQSADHNPFLRHKVVAEHHEAIDEEKELAAKTEFFKEHPRRIVNAVTSPDIPMPYSMNPYQGCEHGCIYCYARTTHHYWGFNAGMDFESKIIVKENAPDLLRAQFEKKSWEAAPIMLSGNTDCYQPAEKRYKLTRKLLEVCLEYRNPVGVITKNSLVTRDIDILKELAQMDLVHVAVSITTLDEKIRRKMEPRTATGKKRLEVVKELSSNGIPVNLMLAPIIPGINSHEINTIMEKAAQAGALGAGYTFVRLNGAIGDLFEEWVRTQFPDRADKVLNQINGAHGGKLSESRFGKRMRGEGPMAEAVKEMFRIAKQRFFSFKKMPEFNCDSFRRPSRDGQLSLF